MVTSTPAARQPSAMALTYSYQWPNPPLRKASSTISRRVGSDFESFTGKQRFPLPADSLKPRPRASNPIPRQGLFALTGAGRLAAPTASDRRRRAAAGRRASASRFAPVDNPAVRCLIPKPPPRARKLGAHPPTGNRASHSARSKVAGERKTTSRDHALPHGTIGPLAAGISPNSPGAFPRYCDPR